MPCTLDLVWFNHKPQEEKETHVRLGTTALVNYHSVNGSILLKTLISPSKLPLIIELLSKCPKNKSMETYTIKSWSPSPVLLPIEKEVMSELEATTI